MTGITPSEQTGKILRVHDLAQHVATLKAQGKTVVHCHGVFDLMHIGHIRHFEQAKRLGDVLVVTVTPDRYVNKGPNRPVFSEAYRAGAIAALACVDFVAVNEWPMATDTIRIVRPDIFVKGSEYREAAKDRTGAIAAEQEVIESVGGKLAFTEDVVFSSSNLLNRYFGLFPEGTERFLTEFSASHSSDEILGYLDRASSLKVLVLGEAIVDDYQYCETLGKSGKEPVLAARYLSSERFAGGILAVANHVAAFSDAVAVLTVIGESDSQEDFISSQLRNGVDKIFLHAPGAPTIVKTRFLESYPFQKLFEVYRMGDLDRYRAVTRDLCDRLSQILPRYDAVVVADYGHGMITPEVAEVLSSQAPFLAVNTQVNAGNHGFNTISRYRRADYICISERELRLDARSHERDLRSIVADTSERLACERLVITRGEQGCLCYRRGEGFCEVPAFTGRVVDRVGAGDAVLSITALCAVLHAPMNIIGFIGSCVGASAVGVVGNRNTIERVPLARYIECLLK